MKKLLTLLLLTVMFATMLSACGKKEENVTEKEVAETEVADKEAVVEKDTSTEAVVETVDSGYKGEITLMHFSTSEESEGNGGSDGFRTMIADWEGANPDVELSQIILANDDFKTQVATLAAANDLPDVFLLQGMNTKAYAEQGLILDMSQIVKDSPYYDQYDQSFFYPFLNEGSTYGLPVLTGGTCTVVAYDSALWAAAGYEKFPETWDEMIAASAYFKEQGIDPVSFGNSGKWQLNSCFLSTVGNRFTGADWTHSLIEKKGAAFTDPEFVAALKFTQDIFATDVFNKDVNAINNEDAREYFIAGDSASFIGGNWDISYIQSAIKGTDLENTMKFAVVPQPAGATGAYNTHDIGMGFALAISSDVAEDPAKLATVTNMVYELTGAKFSQYVAENYALGGLTKVDNVDLSKFDRLTQEFYAFSYVDNNACEIYDSFISGAVWDVLNTDLQMLINGDITPEEVAANAQEVYESSY